MTNSITIGSDQTYCIQQLRNNILVIFGRDNGLLIARLRLLQASLKPLCEHVRGSNKINRDIQGAVSKKGHKD